MSSDFRQIILPNMLLRVYLLMLIFAGHASLAIASDPNGPDTPSSTILGRFVSPLVRSDLKINGSASCAATACHGGPRAGVANEFATRGSEYPLWIERDPHARSWRTICGEKSLAILERLDIIQEDGQISNQAAFDNCLACHNSAKQFSDSRSSELIREGVGCNSCHGPSEKWKSTHYQSTWQAIRNVENGFVPATDLFARARMCASCHIGDRDRDMNHDIIAAGHPALYYEFTTYHQRLPKHWRDPNSTDSQHYESSLWLAGQVAALDASLTLLEARANKALPTSQWPEFASYECSSCHQRLRPGSQEYAPSQGQGGSAVLSRWHKFGVSAMLSARESSGKSSEFEKRFSDSLAALERVAVLSANTTPEAVTIASKEVRLHLDGWLRSRNSDVGLDGSHIDELSAHQLREVLIEAGQRSESLSTWESAAQFYLASIAARAAWPDGLNGNSMRSARELRAVLTFEPGTNTQQARLWETTSGYKNLPVKAGVQHWHAISLAP